MLTVLKSANVFQICSSMPGYEEFTRGFKPIKNGELLVNGLQEEALGTMLTTANSFSSKYSFRLLFLYRFSRLLASGCL